MDRQATQGKVSFYGKDAKAEHLNANTASGEPFDPNQDTIAFPKGRDFGGNYKVTNTANGKSVVVKHNDIGPNTRLNRAGDLSYSAFKKIADEKTGVIDAKIEPHNQEEANLEQEVLRQAAPDENKPFDETFAQARKEGLKTFEWRGKQYTTEVK